MHHKNLRTFPSKKRDTLLHDFFMKITWRSHFAFGDQKYHDIGEKLMPMGHRKKRKQQQICEFKHRSARK